MGGNGIMKTFLRTLFIAFILCGAVNAVFADITCWPGIKVFSPGAGDSWICWDGYASDCLYCSSDVVVKG